MNRRLDRDPEWAQPAPAHRGSRRALLVAGTAAVAAPLVGSWVAHPDGGTAATRAQTGDPAAIAKRLRRRRGN